MVFTLLLLSLKGASIRFELVIRKEVKRQALALIREAVLLLLIGVPLEIEGSLKEIPTLMALRHGCLNHFLTLKTRGKQLFCRS